jgi:hypothetical protein
VDVWERVTAFTKWNSIVLALRLTYH